MTTRPKALAIVGPTASGKSALAMALAERFEAHGGAEIISMDSALVYRGMDIGTAKPSLAERSAVPHHLIDIIEPTDSYSAAQFAHDCKARVQNITERGKTPLIVGGTMLYLKALTQGFDEMPASNPVVRADIAQRAQAVGWPAMHAQLAAIDSDTANRLSPNDGQRIGRALEVWTMTGRPLSAFHRQGLAEPKEAGLNVAVISLQPTDRAWLHARIAERFDAMMEQGFLDEVRTLRGRGDLHAELPSMRAVGYRQAWLGLDNNWPMVDIRNRGIFATRQLAKRQLTWLRGWTAHSVLSCDQGSCDLLTRAWQFVQQSFTFSWKSRCLRQR